jgi:predicted phosphodiesterase
MAFFLLKQKTNMAAITGASEIIREYLDRGLKMPDGKPLPITKLARLIYDENPLLFKDIETTRGRIRYVIGKAGSTHKAKLSGNGQYVVDEEFRMNPYKLPKSDETNYEPYTIGGKRILVLSDIHIPYHSISALTAAFNWAADKNVDTVLLNGDTIDSHQLSRFVRDPKKRHFGEELNAFKDFIQAIKDNFPKAQIIFKEGNHEERYNSFLYSKARELSGVEEFELQNIILSRARGVEYVAEKRVMKAGDLNIIHGHEFIGGTFSPVNIARGLFLKAKVSCMQGHNHQTSEHTEADMNGRITTTWSLGCLSELHPDYMPLNKWNHGFAFIEVEKDGSFQVQNKRIHKGEVL